MSGSPIEQSATITPAAATPAVPKKRRQSLWSIILQLVGFAASLSLLYWCIDLAMRNEVVRQRLRELNDAPPLQLGLLLALSAGTVILSGLVFATVVRPVHKLKWSDVIATNALCTLLGNLPLKISLIVRVLVHNRRDGVPMLTIAGWFAAVSAVIVISLLPPVASALLVGEVSFTWWVIAGGGVVGLSIAAWLLCGYLASETGWSGFLGLVDVVKWKALSRLARSESARNLHAGVRMLASARAIFSAVAFRVMDIGLQAMRFGIAAQLLHIDLTLGQVILAGCSYFFLQAIAPAGALGVREVGAGAVLVTMTGLPKEQLAAVVLTVTAAETAINIVLGVTGALWLRVDRLLVGRKTAPSTE